MTHERYAAFGWATFPCHGKIPATPNGFKAADKTGEVFEKYHGENIGIATGEVSGIWVLDVDVKNGAKGQQSLDGLIAKYGALPETVKARTWSGGTHYFFRMPEGGMGNRTNVMPGIDVRGTGGYVVAPPSVVEGKPYEWILSPETHAVLDAPKWLLALLKTERVSAPPPTEGMIAAGCRNSELTSRAGKMRAAGMEFDDIFTSLIKINATRCSPPLPEKEVRIIAESIGRYAAAAHNSALTDVWNSERFAESYGENIRWCPNLGWFTWNGSHWTRHGKDDPALLVMAKQFVKRLGVQAEATSDKRLKAHAIRSESKARLEAMIELSKSEKGITITAEHLDRNSLLVNCANGTINLATSEIYLPRREDYITKYIDVNYNPDAKAPAWEKFLSEIFQNDTDLVKYVQRAVGYCLTGLTTEQKFFICYGNGRNGKSTLLKHVMHVLGSAYSTGTPAETMLESTGNTLHAIASLKGMRLVVLNEFDEGKTLSSAQVKTLTGGEPVVARHLYHEQFVYVPTYKFFMTTNHKPRIKDTSLGIWRRLVLLPFDYTVAPESIDPGLDDKLAAEYEGILAWSVQGYHKWAETGLGALDRLTREALCYQGQSDLIGQFLEECLDIEADPENVAMPVVEFIGALAAWCRENGIRYAPGRNAVIDYMARKGYGQPSRDNSALSRGKMVWKGVALRPEVGHTGQGNIPIYEPF